MSDYDWSQFNLKININASAQAIYDAWTVPNLLERWFLRRADFLRDKKAVNDTMAHVTSGDKYEWYWHGYDNSVVEKGEIIEANGTDKIVFSFTAGGIVTVNIGDAFGETVVLLTQEKIPTNEEGKTKYHIGCMGGWTFYLANLKSILEGGIDLRNKNPALKNMVNS